MGNCFQKINKSSPSSEIVPADMLKLKPLPSPLPPAITLYGPSNCPITMYIRFALSYKPVSVQFVNSNTLSDMFLDSPVLQFGSERVSGSPVTILGYLDSKFPAPAVGRRRTAAAAAAIVEVVALQHRSVTWHVERVVTWAEDLVTRKGIGRGDRKVGTTRMEVKKFGKRYGELLEVMLEHARMEERVVFPVLEKADRGLPKAANADHARDLPIMNGINEDIKAFGVLDSGNPVYLEALKNLSTRLKTLQKHCHEHFQDEERKLLPLMEAVDLNKGQQERLLEQCFEVMHGTHSHLFRFFIEGLCPQDAMHYLDLVSSSIDREKVLSMFSTILE
ncbi:Hemerythrin/HHE cation-binding motif [Heracleum sosnowskyi]|uniref:Hemerythrin/HHE cation-binding motif n=1 Tax=Heracleum sosnowskyi TaxID=360622 RepID=A0AAD8J4V8_9APIA|nr:Hemerythrin/HHE cation-binding motif [Heracleum sosnowskyi]